MIGTLIGSRFISWLTGPAGRIVLLGLAFAGWTMYHRVDATRDCEDEHLRAQLVENQRQLDIAHQIAEDARDRADATEQEMSELEKAYATLEDSVEPGGGCALDPDTRKRLLDIK